jgi:periplasmic protein TonB
MNRLLISAMLAIFFHGLLFLIWDSQAPQRKGGKAKEQRGIQVRLETDLFRQMDHISQEMAASSELMVSEGPGPGGEQAEKTSPSKELAFSREETNIKQDNADSPLDAKDEKLKAEITNKENKPGPGEAPGLNEQKNALEDISSRDVSDAKEYIPESMVETPGRAERELMAKADSGLAAASLETSKDINGLNRPEAAFQAEKENLVELARPLYRDNPTPGYPVQARKRHYQGTVVLDVLVDARGKAQDVRIAESSGYSILDRAAMEAVENWRFKPGRKNGRPVDTWVKLPVRFELK